MSRIHEALKKAEQERPSTPGRESSAGLPEPGLVHAEASPAGAAENAVIPAGNLREEYSGGLTFETLLKRCAQPGWKPDLKKMLFFNADNHAYGTEEFRTLRTRLYQIRDKQPLQTVLITSALPKEGKSFTAANLAQAIVRQHERRALLIDADLRLPGLHVPLGAPLMPGLSDYLRGDADEFSIIQRSPRENLFFIPGGKPVSNPAELIGNGRLKNLLQGLKPIFDWIVVDSPPVIPVSDATLLADFCDGIVVVVKAASTPFDLAQKASQEFHGKPLLGIVLNRVEPGLAYSSYYYGHYLPGPKNGKVRNA
jgi:protein-tyrosine kinase